MQLRETLGETGAIVMVKPGVLVAAFTLPVFDPEGNLTDQGVKDLIATHLAEFANWIVRVRTPRTFDRFACEVDVQHATA